MPPKQPPTDLPIFAFQSAHDLELFFEREHLTSSGIWLKLARKSSGIPSVSSPEALELALCYGWINGQGLGFDENYYLARYTPRRPKSLWSKVNVGLVAKLQNEGRMQPAGYAAVEAAKSDGRWERAYAGPATMIIADDFAAVLATSSSATSVFENLNKTDRYSVLWRLETASAQNRANKINALVQSLAAGKLPGSSKPTARSTKDAKLMSKPIKKRASSRKTNLPTTPVNMSQYNLRSRS